jgi:hypothetical protein
MSPGVPVGDEIYGHSSCGKIFGIEPISYINEFSGQVYVEFNGKIVNLDALCGSDKAALLLLAWHTGQELRWMFPERNKEVAGFSAGIPQLFAVCGILDEAIEPVSAATYYEPWNKAVTMLNIVVDLLWPSMWDLRKEVKS